MYQRRVMPEISQQTAQILLGVCRLVGGQLQDAQAKIAVGQAQMELEETLAPKPEPPKEENHASE